MTAATSAEKSLKWSKDVEDDSNTLKPATTAFLAFLEERFANNAAPATVSDIARLYAVLAVHTDALIAIVGELQKMPIIGPRPQVTFALESLSGSLAQIEKGLTELATRVLKNAS